MNDVKQRLDVLVGTPIYREGAYILEKFLANQKEIQQRYPPSELVLATVEHDFAEELEKDLDARGIRGKVLRYEVVMPAHARSRYWNAAVGREAIRQYMLAETEAGYLLCFDADMTYDPQVIDIMLREIRGHDIVNSGYVTRGYGLGLTGAGCCMLTRRILGKLVFRCFEFRNGDVLVDDNMLEMDAFLLGARTRRGVFLSIDHYKNENEASSVVPQRVGTLRRLANSSPARYFLVRTSLIAGRNVPWALKRIIDRFHKDFW